MFKNILLSGLLCSSLMAESFDDFLHRALHNSPYLQASALGIEQAKQKAQTYTRYTNPSLELEYSRFDANNAASEDGFRANYTQPLRLWDVQNANKKLGTSEVANADAKYIRDKATFIRDISLYYTRYVQSKMLLDLANEELGIAQNIYNISQARYKAGTISKGVMLQAKIDYEMNEIKNENTTLAMLQNYYALLKMAGVSQDLELDTSHTFVQDATSDINNPELLILSAQQKSADAKELLYANKLEYVDVFGEFEKEPEQNIARFGISVPLAFFNDRSQEKHIAKLKSKEFALLIENTNTQTAMQLRQIEKTKQLLKNMQLKNKKVLKTEEELLAMFEDGYKIANINLLELQDIKNKLIETKMRLIKITTALNQNAIISNYLQGKYNE